VSKKWMIVSHDLRGRDRALDVCRTGHRIKKTRWKARSSDTRRRLTLLRISAAGSLALDHCQTGYSLVPEDDREGGR